MVTALAVAWAAVGAAGICVRTDGDFLEYEVWPEDLPRFRNADRAGQPVHEMPLAFPSREFGFGCMGHLPEKKWKKIKVKLLTYLINSSKKKNLQKKTKI